MRQQRALKNHEKVQMYVCSTESLSHLWCKKWVYQRYAHSCRFRSSRCGVLSASFDSKIHSQEHAIIFTVQPWNSTKRHPSLWSLCIAHIFSSALTDREIDLLMTDKTGDAEPIRRKLPKGKKQRRKKCGRVTPDQREALLWPTGDQVFEVLIKIHTELNKYIKPFE